MDNKKGLLLAIFVLFLGMLITGGSYAFWQWQSTDNKNVTFNIASNLREYIEYDNGDSKVLFPSIKNTPPENSPDWDKSPIIDNRNSSAVVFPRFQFSIVLSNSPVESSPTIIEISVLIALFSNKSFVDNEMPE